MSSFIGAGIARAIGGAMVMAFIAGGLFFALVVFGIPWLWRLIKPWLHTVTG